MSEPKEQTVGWVMDKDTSRRRIHIYIVENVIGLAVEVGQRWPARVALDAEGASYLQGLLGEAVQREQAGQER